MQDLTGILQKRDETRPQRVGSRRKQEGSISVRKSTPLQPATYSFCPFSVKFNLHSGAHKPISEETTLANICFSPNCPPDETSQNKQNILYLNKSTTVDLSLKAPAPRQGVNHAGVPRAIRFLANSCWTDDSRIYFIPWPKVSYSLAPTL